MARSKGRSGGGRRSGGGGSSRRAAAEPVADEIEVVEEEGGMGIEDGIVAVTTILLLCAFLFIDYARGTYHGAGLLFKGAYEAPSDAGGGDTPAAPADDEETGE